METIAQYAGWISGIIGCITAIVVGLKKLQDALKKPLEDIRQQNRKQTIEMERQGKKLDSLTQDVARLQGDRLNQAFDYYTQRGWCPGAKKRELQDWYNSYKAGGNNHLADHYIDAIINLPEHPPAQ